jgi:LysR family hydrogen peroxide-inducible transcriptional activator
MSITRLAPHRFTLRQLQYVVAVADRLSFHKAADACSVTQPSLSAQIAQLEAGLGLQLFERDRRRVLLTDGGRDVVERARRLLVEADDLHGSASSLGDPLARTLRVGVIPTISPYLLPAITPALRAAYPKLTLNWVEDKTEVLVRDLDVGSLDASLLALEADIGELEHEPIVRDVFVLAAPRDHPLARNARAAKPAELRRASVLLLDDGHCFREQALVFCSKAKARELEFRATSLSTLAQMVAGGAGVTLLPELAVPTESRRAEIVIRRFAKPVPHRTIALVWRKRSPLGAVLRRLAATMRSAYPARS